MDGAVIPYQPLAAFEAGIHHRVPIIVGTSPSGRFALQAKGRRCATAGSNLNEGQNIEYTREDDRRFQKGFRGIHMGWTVRLRIPTHSHKVAALS